jgi:hypothetical protein
VQSHLTRVQISAIEENDQTVKSILKNSLEGDFSPQPHPPLSPPPPHGNLRGVEYFD